MKKQIHDHLYYRIKYGKNKRILYGCKTCSTHISPEFLVGRIVLCNDCLTHFEVKNKKDLVKTIKCRKCRRRVDIDDGDVLNFLEGLAETQLEKEIKGTIGLMEKEEEDK